MAVRAGTVRPFVELLYADAPPEAFTDQVDQAVAAGADDEELAGLREELAVALRVREQLARHRRREAGLTALYDTANDLTAIRDVDSVLQAIVRRARQLLNADITYLSLNDEAEGASFMRVTDGSVSAEFRDLRLPLGTGLLGLVAQRGAPYSTDDYFEDRRFVHRDYIDHAVEAEGIRAILGVPLTLDGKVIGALLAGNRSRRPFPASEAELLGSFAAHAAIALENARLFQQTRAANEQIRAQSESVELAASAHDRLTDVLLAGGGAAEVAGALADVLRGEVLVLDPHGHRLAGTTEQIELDDRRRMTATEESRRSARTVEVPGEATPTWVAAAVAGSDHLGTLVLQRAADLEQADRRTFERGALVTALLLLFQRLVADAQERVRGELVDDLLSNPPRDVEALPERAQRQGVDLAREHVVLVVGAERVERHRVAAAASRLAAGRQGVGGARGAEAVLVLRGTDPVGAARWAQSQLADLGGTVTVGASGPATGVRALGTAYRSARQCLMTLLALGRTGEVADPAGLGFARLLLGESGAAELREFVRGMVGPVLEYDERRGTELLATLDAWFGCGGRTAEAAKALHVHPNTVGQRLERVTTLLGHGWREPQRALEIQLAVRLWRLRDVAPPH
ncbi:MAG TPA: GAF domain-containing protein [Nocardioidaceae bacterium]|nr:GAF domain-containing protein [Nocardioidaceae bacterium]